jgi:iron complex outermembrane recepter protein
MELGNWCSSAMLRCVKGHLGSRGRAQLLILSATASATALLSAPGVTRAAETPAEGTDSGTVAEVIVTATRREERLLDVPVSASALSGESLEVLGSSGQDIRQLAFAVPSLNIESSNGRTFPRFYIRGYGNTDFNSFASQPVSLVYDDVVQENPALKGFPVFDQADVEVLRGPQGTLFGRNTPAGVVKLESAKPVIGEFLGSASVSDGTYNTANFTGVVNVPINDQLAFRAATQGQHRDDWVKDNINHTKLEGYDDWAARLQLLYKPNDDLSALFNVHGRILNGSARLFRANIIQLGSNQLVPGFDPAQFFADGYNGQSYSSVGANVHVTWNLPTVTLHSITGYESILHYNTIGDIDGGYGPGGLVDPTVPSGPGFIPFSVATGGGIVDHYQLTEELRAVSRLEGPLQGQAGIFVFDEDVKAVGNTYNRTGFADDLVYSVISRQKNDAQAIFGSLEYTFLPELKVRAGVRYTKDHKTFSVPYAQFADGTPLPLTGSLSKSADASNVSWDVSPTWQVQPDVNLYARIATGFRAPSFGAPSSNQAIQVAQSEKNISYETGIKAELFDRRARVAFDVFYYDVSHQQLTAVGGSSNVTALINAGHTKGKGAELDFEARPIPNLTVNLSGSFNQTRIEDKNLAVNPCFNWSFISPEIHCNITNPSNAAGLTLIDGNPLPQAARWAGNLSLRYGVPLSSDSELYVYTDWSYRSEINFFLYEAKEFVGPALTQGGLRIGYTWADKKYEVAAFCRNCTNQIRVIGAIDFENATGFINDPRIVGGQISVKF